MYMATITAGGVTRTRYTAIFHDNPNQPNPRQTLDRNFCWDTLAKL
jgi:hypothetical protein